MLQQRKEQDTLSDKTIDRLSQICVESLTEAGTDHKDIIRIRLSLEEILGIWQKELGQTDITCRTGQKFGRQYIVFEAAGRPVNVMENEADLFLCNRLLSQAGLTFIYSYQDGINRLSLNPPRKVHIGQMGQLFMAIVSAILLGMLVRRLGGSVRDVSVAVTEPIFDMILGVLRAISSPLIFLSVCWGIISIGDLSSVGKIGRQVTGRLIGSTFLIGMVMAFLICRLFPFTSGTAGNIGNGAAEIYRMILDIVPSDIVSPFLNGNALQIIFLGICLGLAMLVLGERVQTLVQIVVQANEAVQFLMGLIGKVIPLFVFLSIFSLLQSELGIGFAGIVKVFGIAVPGCFLLTLLYLLLLKRRFRVSFRALVKKMLPTCLIGLSTASSAAAFATNLETCEKELGIPRRVVNFAIPLGQVIYKPGAVVGFLAVALCMAQYYGVGMTPVWLVTAVLIVGLLAMAAPPIPGGALTCYTVMFVQFGIPGEAIAVAVAINSILDFVMTAANLTCLQAEVMFAADHLALLDKDSLCDGKGV